LRRIAEIVVHNWPLKLAAIGLATLLYGGLVLSQDAQTFAGPIQIQYTSPEGMWVDPLPPVTSVRYFAPADTDRPGQDTFRASVDLSGLPQSAGTYNVPVQVTSVNPQIQVLGVTPQVVQVTLDPLITKIVPVAINTGQPPDDVEVGAQQAEPSTVTITGQQSIVDQVVAARADVVIQESGLNIDQDVILVPVDQLGNPRSPVRVTPTTSRIRVQVLTEPDTRTIPINPVTTGTPATGFELATVTVEPQAVLVEGDADALASIAGLDTQPLSISGLSEETSFDTDLDMPSDVARVTDEQITVTVTFRPVTESRSYSVGLELVGPRLGFDYALASNSVLLTVGGNPTDLEALSTGTVLGQLDVTDLEPGTYDVDVSATLPDGVTLVAASPPTVAVTVTAPAAPSPSPTPTPAS
jgi:YbbR domain-containing protein